MTGPDQNHPEGGSTPWQRSQNLSQQSEADGGQQNAASDDPTTVVSRDELAGATPQPRAGDGDDYPTSQDYRAAGADAGADAGAEPEVHGYPVTRDPEIAEAARQSELATDTAAADSSRPGSSTPGPATSSSAEFDQPPTQWHDGPTDDATRQFSAAPSSAPSGYPSPTEPPFGDRQGYQPTPAYSAAEQQQSQAGPPMGGAPGQGPADSQGQPVAYGSSSTGFFSQQAMQSGRVELAPAKTRIGQNLLGALLVLIFVSGADALYAVVFKNATGTVGTGTGHKLALIGLALVVAIPALLSGWAPAAGWFPGIVLVLGVGVAIFSDSLTQKYAEWSNSLFGSTRAAEFLLQWGMVAGFALLLAGIGAQLARRSAEHAVIDRMVNR